MPKLVLDFLKMVITEYSPQIFVTWVCHRSIESTINLYAADFVFPFCIIEKKKCHWIHSYLSIHVLCTVIRNKNFQSETIPIIDISQQFFFEIWQKTKQMIGVGTFDYRRTFGLPKSWSVAVQFLLPCSVQCTFSPKTTLLMWCQLAEK